MATVLDRFKGSNDSDLDTYEDNSLNLPGATRRTQNDAQTELRALKAKQIGLKLYFLLSQQSQTLFIELTDEADPLFLYQLVCTE